MNNVLIYIEPHPIRNSVTEFAGAGKNLCEIAEYLESYNIHWKVYANKWTLLELEKTVNITNIIKPTEEENEFVASAINEWDETEIEKRQNIIRGSGDNYQYYYSILERLYSSYKFSHIIIWSENGAVRKFADHNNLNVIHFELGPTRKPFLPTLYFDPKGTNGDNSLSLIKLKDIATVSNLNPDSWLSLSIFGDEIKQDSKDARGAKEITQIPLPEELLAVLKDKFVVIALQLADDLNTVDHSPFKTPLDFLSKVLPPLKNLGYQIVIKRHPAAVSRIFNLIKEEEAIDYVRKLDQDVIILDSAYGYDCFIPLCARASAVLSINSSVSLEAWLIGTPGLVFGNASYDIDNYIKNLSYNFLKGKKLDFTKVSLILSFLFDKYLHPFDKKYISNILAKYILNNKNSKNSNFISWLIKNVHNSTYLAEQIKYDLLSKDIGLKKSIALNASKNLSHLKWNIEKISIDKKGPIKEFKLVGWIGAVTAKDNAQSILNIAIIYKNECLCMEPMKKRLDVFNVHPFLGKNTGFNLTFSLPSRYNLNEIKLVLLGTDEGYITNIVLGDVI